MTPGQLWKTRPRVHAVTRSGSNGPQAKLNPAPFRGSPTYIRDSGAKQNAEMI